MRRAAGRLARRAFVRCLLVGVLFALDAALAHLAVEIDAAGALLSPGGAVSLGAIAAAAGFAAVRLAFVGTVCASAGWTASDVLGAAWPATPSEPSPREPATPSDGDHGRR